MSSCRADVPQELSDEALLLAPAPLFAEPVAVPVGPGFDIVMVPEHHARQAVALLDRLALDPIGSVFADHDRWGFFLPEESDSPAWPPATEYLHGGASVTLPPFHWPAPAYGATGWVRHRADGRLFTAPLMLHPVLDAVSNGACQFTRR